MEEIFQVYLKAEILICNNFHIENAGFVKCQNHCDHDKLPKECDICCVMQEINFRLEVCDCKNKNICIDCVFVIIEQKYSYGPNKYFECPFCRKKILINEKKNDLIDKLNKINKKNDDKINTIAYIFNTNMKINFYSNKIIDINKEILFLKEMNENEIKFLDNFFENEEIQFYMSNFSLEERIIQNNDETKLFGMKQKYYTIFKENQIKLNDEKILKLQNDVKMYRLQIENFMKDLQFYKTKIANELKSDPKHDSFTENVKLFISENSHKIVIHDKFKIDNKKQSLSDNFRMSNNNNNNRRR